ncbi:hypothetical protein C8A05DRAFT_42725 [Staphylotrichum tortipilum]|uniref:F-box domain-containing protein n=1 Tax=Staphylotrichum tortipilum TaxID=2831512 RepID=A0AAN6RVZ8_9PEZI|nr:hypothetical protein C8A05DRAFT_42725 [Staphylotrichum longicolle]
MAASGGSSVPLNETEIMMALNKGRDLMENKEYSKALRAIMDAVNMCPCSPSGAGTQARHGKDKSCHIQQCVTALKKEDHPDALYQVAKCPCACGYSWPACPRLSHASALDTLVECLDKAEQHLSAFSTALSVIRLDPTSAIGYCRTAKMLQNMHKNSSASSDTAMGRAQAAIIKGYGSHPPAHPFRQLLGRLVESGLHSTTQYRHRPRDTYDVVLQRMAHSLKIKQARRDPATAFPREVFTMILAYLTSSDLNRCILVNKQWNQALERDDTIWANLEYLRPGNPGRFLGRFVQRHRGIKSLIIRNGSAFQLTGAKLNTILHGLRHLRRLVLRSGVVSQQPQKVEFSVEARPGAPVPRTALRQLSLFSYDVEAPGKTLIELNMNSLLVLDLVDTGTPLSRVLGAIKLPRLVRLRIVETPSRSMPHGFDLEWLEMEPIAVAAPNLKELQLDGLIVGWTFDSPPLADKYTFWQSLEVLVLGPLLHFPPEFPSPFLHLRFFPPLPSSLRRLEILGPTPDIAHNLLYTTDPPDPASAPPQEERRLTPHLPNLEVFRCFAGLLDPPLLESIIGPAAKSGTLKVLDLSASDSRSSTATMASPTIQSDFLPARDLPFAASDGLHTLGLRDFNFHRDPASRFGASSRFDGQPFLDWLECFPALHTVAAYPGDWDGVDAFLMRLIIHPRVKVLYQRNLRGAVRDEALALAKKHGVKLVHREENVFEEWPLTEDWVMRE